MPYLELPAARLFFTDDRPGADPPPAGVLLLVHGWGGDSQEWADHIAALRAHFRVLAPDLPGHGASRQPGQPVLPADHHPFAQADVLAALLRDRDTGPVTAVGHSMGGQTVTALAVRHPDLVSSLVVLDPAYGADAAEAARIPAEQAALAREGVDWAVTVVSRAYAPDAPIAARTRQERAMLTMDPAVLLAARHGLYLAPDSFGVQGATETYLRRRQCPTLAIFSNAEVAAWHRTHTLTHPASRILTWPGTGHYLHQERPQALIQTLTTWTRTHT